MIHEDTRIPIPLFIDACATGAGTICGDQAYHPLCHMEAVNVVAALRTWAHRLMGCRVHLHNIAIQWQPYSNCWGRDSYIQACTCELWLICAHADITLAISHISRESLTQSVDALRRYYMGQAFKGQVRSQVD